MSKYRPPRTKVSGKPQHIRVVDGAEDSWFYEEDKTIDVYAWPTKIPGRVQKVVHVRIPRHKLLKYIERSKP